MRLINVNTLDIESFLGQAEQPYVILSHRWGPDEVKFEDYASYKTQIKEQMSKPQGGGPTTGISKIAGACLQSRKLKLRYLWIDTCCIDKRSTSEESESINSMFSWYKEARICLAHLKDIVKGSNKSFSDSEWFTRGWTLQELLAPKDITFFDRDWNQLGTKVSRSTDIEKATRIAPRHMINFESACMATRMSWQAGRKTTRIEDLAYSLFGICEVGMDLRYGERDKAFRRLQEQIINSDAGDESILAWESDELGDDKPSGVLAPRPDCFKRSANLTIASPSHKYRHRDVYRISNKGLEMSAKMAAKTRTALGTIATQLPILMRRSNLDVTLNCWELGRQGPATVVIRLERDSSGSYSRTNCKKLDWARSTDWRSNPLMGNQTSTIAMKL